MNVMNNYQMRTSDCWNQSLSKYKPVRHNGKLHVNMEKKHFKFIQLLNILPYLFTCLYR